MKKILIAALLIISIVAMARIDGHIIHQSTYPSLSQGQTK